MLGGAGLTPVAPDPYAIFGKARAFWLTQRYPEVIRYRVAVAIVEGGKPRVEHYDAQFDAVNDVVGVDAWSDYERKHPVVPKGANINLIFWQSKPLPVADFLGVPKLTPTYSFGMAPFVPAPTPTPFNSMALVAEIRKEFHDPDPHKTPVPPPTPTPLPEIAVVVARMHDYSIRLLGTENVDGHPCYHLALTPTREPGRFRIREAWIDESTYATWKLRDALNFTNGAGTRVPWTIRFVDVDGAHYIAEEDADAPMSVSGEVYTKAAIRFEDIAAATPGKGLDIGIEPRNMLVEP